MSGSRPKLHLIGGDPEALQDLADLVGDRYDIIQSDPDGRSGSGIIGNAAELLLDAIGEAACIASQYGKVIWTNHLFAQLDDQLAQQVDDILRQVRQQIDKRRRTRLTSGPDQRVWAFEGGDRSGETHYEITVTVLDHNADGDQSALGVVLRDVTAQRQTQQKMDAIHRAGYELARFDPEQIMKMNGIERMELLESKISSAARDLLNFDHYAIFLLDQKRKKLQLVIAEGLPSEIEDLDLFIEREGSGISGHVAATGESYLCYDAQCDEMYLPGMLGARSSLTVPLRLHDQVIGILDIEAGEPGQFDEQDLQFVEIFSRHIAMALHLLDLLVAERCDVNAQVSDRFEGELAEPLADIVHEVDWLRSIAHDNPESAEHIARIEADVRSIRQRVRDMASGPQTLLGVEKFREDRREDPLLVGKRLLIADDAKKIRKVIGEILGHRGAIVTVCQNGSEAIEAINHSAATGEPFDLIVSDIQMPDHNGYEVFSSARNLCPGAPVILMTGFGYDPHHSIVRASQDGLHSVLFKPFELEQLVQQIHAALEPEPAKG